MTREELTEMIRKEIRELAFETLRNSKKEKNKNDFKPRGLTEEEIEFNLFYGGEKPNEDGTFARINIKEGYESGIPKINSSDIKKFEDDFEKELQGIDGASVIFDKQSNEYSIKMWIGSNGIEAGASGSIEMGKKGRIEWAFSLQDGLTVSTEDLVVEKGNREVFEKLYYSYDAWQKYWREKLTITPGEAGSMDEPEAGTPPDEMGAAEELPA